MEKNELLVFEHAVEGMIRALGSKLDATNAARLREAGLDVAHILPAYPLDVWLKLMVIAADITSPGATKEQAMYDFGRRFLEGYTDTLLGKALLTMIRVLGPKRTLERMTRNFRSGNNYSQTELKPVGEREFDLWCNHVNYSEWYRGLISAGVEASGGKNVQISVLKHDSTGAIFRIKYD